MQPPPAAVLFLFHRFTGVYLIRAAEVLQVEKMFSAGVDRFALLLYGVGAVVI